MSDTGAKGRSTTDEDEFSEITKTVKRDDCLWAHGARSEKSATRGGKDRSRVGNCKTVQKVKNVSIVCRPTTLVLKKVRHVGQRQKQTWQL